MSEIVNQFKMGGDFSQVKGIVYREKDTGQIKKTPPRDLNRDLNTFPNPSRELFDNNAYKKYYSKKFGYTTTAIMSSRGCPFSCDFCSKPVFGNDFRARAATKVADEIEEVISLGYSRIWFADDCFTLDRERLIGICDEIIKRGLKIGWECLSRVDTLDPETVDKMKQAGCLRMFFGIESGNDSILALMKKQITTKQVQEALFLCKNSGIKAGAFFIVGYPGENDKTVLETIKFASSLPLDYLSFTLPYPIPGTPLYERLNGELISDEWEEPKNINFVNVVAVVADEVIVAVLLDHRLLGLDVLDVLQKGGQLAGVDVPRERKPPILVLGDVVVGYSVVLHYVEHPPDSVDLDPQPLGYVLVGPRGRKKGYDVHDLLADVLLEIAYDLLIADEGIYGLFGLHSLRDADGLLLLGNLCGLLELGSLARIRLAAGPLYCLDPPGCLCMPGNAIIPVRPGGGPLPCGCRLPCLPPRTLLFIKQHHSTL